MAEYKYILKAEHHNGEIVSLILKQKEPPDAISISKITGKINNNDIRNFIKTNKNIFDKTEIVLEIVQSGLVVEREHLDIVHELRKMEYDNIVVPTKQLGQKVLDARHNLAQSLLQDGYTIKLENNNIIVIDK